MDKERQDRHGQLDQQALGAIIGALLIILISLLGIGITAIVFIFGVIGYFIGSYLDGDFDLEDIRARAQGRGNNNQQ